MNERVFNVLFLCTGNSSRSILAEGLMNRWGGGRFRGFSAGSHPSGTVNPHAIALLEKVGIATAGVRSKSWDEFVAPGAPQMNFIFTVCDNAAGEVCPYWPGIPMTAHWGVPDPAAVQGSEAEKERAFWSAFRSLETRIKLFAALPLAKLDELALRHRLADIGAVSTES
jgi:arsenate reductase